jgi:hypothetical protein
MVRRRVEGWPMILSQMLREQKDQPFVWGTNDCLIFPANVVNALTGFDPAEGLRGTYDGALGAQNIVDEAGGIEALITARLGIPGTRDILTGNRGDVVIMKTAYGIMGGIIDDSGSRIAVPISDQQTLVRFPLSKAWRVWSY